MTQDGPATDNGTGCSVIFNLPFTEDTQDPCFPDKLQGFRISGIAPEPDSAEVILPDSCLPSANVVFDPFPDSDGGLVGNTGICNDGTQTSGDADCNTWPQGSLNYYELVLPYPESGDCDDYAEDMELEPVDWEDPCGESVESLATGTGCTPGVGVPMDFAYWKLYDLDNDGTFHAKLQPVQMSGAAYSERAWLRKIVVTDWGDASEFHVRGFGEPWVVSSTDVIDGSHSLALTTGNTPKTFSVGQVTMGTTWSIDGVVPTGGYFELPKVEMDWSCQVDSQNPHFVDAGATQGYARSLSTLGITGLTYSQRLILRFPSTSKGTLELEGRSSDRLEFDLTPVSPGVFGFSITNPARDGSALSGTISASGTNRVVAFSELVLQGTDLGTPTWAFAEYP